MYQLGQVYNGKLILMESYPSIGAAYKAVARIINNTKTINGKSAVSNQLRIIDKNTGIVLTFSPYMTY